MLGVDGTLKFQYKQGNLIIQVPNLTVDELPCQYAWSFRITEIEE